MPNEIPTTKMGKRCAVRQHGYGFYLDSDSKSQTTGLAAPARDRLEVELSAAHEVIEQLRAEVSRWEARCLDLEMNILGRVKDV